MEEIEPTIDITLGGVKILTLKVLISLAVAVDVHLVKINPTFGGVKILNLNVLKSLVVDVEFTSWSS